MTYVFDGHEAQKYGIPAAILLSNLRWWVAKNKANGKHFHDGRTWSYNSIRALAKLYPFLNERQIRYALKKLEKVGVVLTANYNKQPYDHTKWYALADESICPNYQIDSIKSSNRSDKNVKPIPDSIPDNTPDSIPDSTLINSNPITIRNGLTINRFSNFNNFDINTAIKIDNTNIPNGPYQFSRSNQSNQSNTTSRSNQSNTTNEFSQPLENSEKKKLNYNIPPHLKESNQFVQTFKIWIDRENPSINEIRDRLLSLKKYEGAEAEKILQYQIKATDKELDIASIFIAVLNTIKHKQPDSRDYDTAIIIARSIISFHKRKTWGLPTQPGTPRFHFPSSGDLADFYGKWLIKNYGGWRDITIHAMKTSSKIWREFIQETEQDYMINEFKT